MRRLLIAPSTLLALTLALPAAEAQRDVPELPNFAYNPAPPGARSLAMGATFIGIADDATAAESNPAGLTILRKPELSAHVRFSSFTTEFPDTVNVDRSTGALVRSKEFNDKVTAPSFLSLAFPAGKLAGSLYYYQSGNFDSHSEFRGEFPNCDGISGCFNIDRIFFGYRLENFGAALAAKAGPHLSIGGSVRLSRIDVDSRRSVFLGPTAFAPTEDLFELDLQDDDTDVTFNLGAMLFPGRKVSVGVVYKDGGEFEIDQVLRFSSRDVIGGGAFVPFLNQTQPVTIEVPDTIGGGIALRATERWTVAADVVHIKYSNLRGSEDTLPDDETEVHAGTEYTMLKWNTPISLRAGFYHEPDHDNDPNVDTDRTHVTFGGGVVLQENFQMDVAASLSDQVKEALMSFVVRF